MQTLNRLIFMDFVPLWYDTTSWAQWTLCYFHSVNILFYIRSAKAVKLYVLSAMLFTIFHPFLWCLIKWFEYFYTIFIYSNIWWFIRLSLKRNKLNINIVVKKKRRICFDIIGFRKSLINISHYIVVKRFWLDTDWFFINRMFSY